MSLATIRLLHVELVENIVAQDFQNARVSAIKIPFWQALVGPSAQSGGFRIDIVDDAVTGAHGRPPIHKAQCPPYPDRSGTQRNRRYRPHRMARNDRTRRYGWHGCSRSRYKW